MWFRKRKRIALIEQVRQLERMVYETFTAVQKMEKAVMADLSKLRTSVSDLTARVKRATSVEAGVKVLMQDIVAQNKALADKIANMTPESVTQADLDELSDQVSQAADALDAGTQPLADAVADTSGTSAGGNTPADTNPPIDANGNPPASNPPDSSATVDATASGQTFGAKRGAQQGSGEKAKPLGGTSAEERAEAQRAADAEAKQQAPVQPSTQSQYGGSTDAQSQRGS